MSATLEHNRIPSDVTVDSSTSGRTSTRGISKDLLAVVGETEKSFEDALHHIRTANYLPTKYSGGPAQYKDGARSHLHKQLKAMPTETDKLLGSFDSTDSSKGGNIIDDASLQTDDQSQWSKPTIDSRLQDPSITSVLLPEKVGAKIIHVEAERETSTQDTTATENEVFVPMDYKGCERFKIEIRKNLKLHRLACDYLRFRNFLFFQVPQLILAMASSILAFMVGSNILDVGWQKNVTTIAGCCSAFVVFLQTMSGYCRYGQRASMHDSTTIYLRDLDDDVTLFISKMMNSEIIEEQSEYEGSPLKQKQKLSNNEDSFESLQSRYRHSLKGCRSDVPTQITEAFSEIDSYILLSRTTANRKYLVDCGMFESQNFRGITLKCYDRLASNMVGSYYWPLKIPSSQTLVKKTMEETRFDLHQMNSFWETPPPKESSLLCLSFGNSTSDKKKYVQICDTVKTT